MQKLGMRVSLYRKSKQMSQKQLALASDLTQATISRLESGQIDQLKSDALQRIARALGKSVDTLMGIKQDRRERIDEIFDFVVRDPDFRYGTRLTGDLDTEAKLFIIELYEKATGRRLLVSDQNEKTVTPSQRLIFL